MPHSPPMTPIPDRTPKLPRLMDPTASSADPILLTRFIPDASIDEVEEGRLKLSLFPRSDDMRRAGAMRGDEATEGETSSVEPEPVEAAVAVVVAMEEDEAVEEEEGRAEADLGPAAAKGETKMMEDMVLAHAATGLPSG